MDDFPLDEIPETPLRSKRDFIFQLPIFQDIRHLPARRGGSTTPARSFLSICHEYTFDTGTVIAEQEDMADSLYIVESGRVRALDVSFNEKNEQVFRPIPEEVFGPGQWFHDAWLFRPATHPFLIQAVRPGRLIKIKSADFIKFLKSFPRALQVIYPNLSQDAQQIIMQSRFQDFMGKSFGQGGTVRRVGSQPGRSRRHRTERDGGEGARLTTDQLKQIRKLNLLPEEYVEFFARRSYKILGFHSGVDLILATLLLVFPAWLMLGAGAGTTLALTVGGLLALLPLLDLLFYWINWRNCYFVITNRRLVRYQLLLFRFQTRVEKIDIDKVQTVNIKKDNPIYNYLRIGTAEITTAAQSAVLYFDAIDRPERVEVILEKIRREERMLDASRLRSSMRGAVDKHFNLDESLNKIKAPPPPIPPTSFFTKLQERFIKEESAGYLIYHKHPIALVKPMIWPATLFLILVIALYAIYHIPDLQSLPFYALAGILVSGNMLWIFWQFEDWRNDTYQITDRYIYDVDRKPLGFGEDRKVAELSQVQNVRTEQDGLLPTVFNFGNVQVETAGVDSNIVFENVRDPRHVQSQIFAKRDSFRRLQEEGQKARQLDHNTTLIEMYEERRARGLIPRFRPLPDIDEDQLD